MADFTRAGLRPSDWWREAVRPGAEQIETITELKRLIDRLEAGESLTEDEWVSLIEGRSPELADYLFEKARCIREREYGKAVYVRGLIECSNYCEKRLSLLRHPEEQPKCKPVPPESGGDSFLL